MATNTTINTDPNMIDNPNPAATGDEIDGMNIFWILFALSVASSIHNLGSAPGFPGAFTRYFRILPLSSLFDLSLMYLNFLEHWSPWQRWRQHQSGDTSLIRRAVACTRMLVSSARLSARKISIRRFALANKDNLDQFDLPTSTSGNEAGRDEALAERLKLRLSVSIPYLLDFWPRFFANVGLIFVYTKICGFTNVPFSTAIATIYFVSWFGMEVFLYLAFGLSRDVSIVHRQELKDVLTEHPRRGTDDAARRERILRAIGVFLNIGQLIALVMVFIVAAVSGKQDGGEDQSPAQRGKDENALWSFIKAWFSTAWNLPQHEMIGQILNWKWGIFMSSWRAVLQVGGDNIVLHILAIVSMGLLTAILILPFLIASFLTMYIPCFLSVLLWVFPYSFLLLFSLRCYDVYVLFPSLWEKIEARAEKVRMERWHLVLRLAVGGLIAGALIFFNVFFDGRQTGKEDWTGKLD